jgi:hypothetical protein
MKKILLFSFLFLFACSKFKESNLLAIPPFATEELTKTDKKL